MKKIILMLIFLTPLLAQADLPVVGTVRIELDSIDKQSLEHQITRALLAEEWIKSTQGNATRVSSVGVVSGGYCLTANYLSEAYIIGDKIEKALSAFKNKVIVSTDLCNLL